MNNFTRVVFIVTLLSCHKVMSQNTFSPYTVFGIGDMYNKSMSHNMGMGEIGIGTPSVWNINNMNPALLTANTLSVFEIGIQGENRTIANELDEQKAGTAGYKNLSFAFPVVAGKWTTNFGIAPMSSVNYKFNSNLPIEGSETEAELTFEGNGGLTEVNWSNGIRLFKGLSVGIRSSFVFGFTEHSTTSILSGNVQQFPTTIVEKTNYSGLKFGFGASYGQKIGDSGNSLGFGIIYDVAKDLSGDRIVRLEADTGGSTVTIGDTLSNRSYTDAFNLPSKLGFGVSWIKDNFLTIGIDVSKSFWTEDAGFGVDIETYRNTYSAGIGLEITPKYDDVDSYISRIRYRIGFRYEQQPYIVGGTNIDDIGINFGWSLPIRGVSSLNMAFKFGQRGTTSDNLIKENYFKFVIGATINDRWFVRRKYN
ncbi:MAG: hypothetical protein JXR07_07010 [Reichenbachiella sp.]